MTYAGKNLAAHGQGCTVNRNPPASSKVSLKRSTRASRDLGVREGYWEGLILADSMLQSGETITINGSTYLIQSANDDPASGERAFFAAKANARLLHKRYAYTGVDENNNPLGDWIVLHPNAPAFGEIITYRMRQEDPGLLDSARYTFQVQKSIGITLRDRLIYDGIDLEVVSIDDVAMEGIARVQAGADVRGK